jgi:DNA-binding transcriptional LysR family regulator
MLNLRSVDLNLLPIFEAAYEERSLSRAAQRLAMTQPAVSHAIARLRALFRDALFIRQSHGVLPTPVADLLYGKLRGAMGAVREAVVETRGFDPKTSERQFFVTIPHPLGPMMAVALRARLARAAPRVHVAFSTRSRPVDLDRAMHEGRVDAAVDWLAPGGDQYREAIAFEDGLLAMARRGHPMLKERSTAQVIRHAEFVSLRPRVAGDNPVAALREWQRLRLKIALEVSEYIEVLLVANKSDLVAIVPSSMEKLAHALFGLRALPLVPRVKPIPIKLIWHQRQTDDAAHAYLRAQLVASARQVVSGPATE